MKKQTKKGPTLKEKFGQMSQGFPLALLAMLKQASSQEVFEFLELEPPAMPDKPKCLEEDCSADAYPRAKGKSPLCLVDIVAIKSTNRQAAADMLEMLGIPLPDGWDRPKPKGKPAAKKVAAKALAAKQPVAAKKAVKPTGTKPTNNRGKWLAEDSAAWKSGDGLIRRSSYALFSKVPKDVIEAAILRKQIMVNEAGLVFVDSGKEFAASYWGAQNSANK